MSRNSLNSFLYATLPFPFGLVSFQDDFEGKICLVIHLFCSGSCAPECWCIVLFQFNLWCNVGLHSKILNLWTVQAIDAAFRLGYFSLRKEQEEAVKNFASGNDVLNMMTQSKHSVTWRKEFHELNRNRQVPRLFFPSRRNVKSGHVRLPLGRESGIETIGVCVV